MDSGRQVATMKTCEYCGTSFSKPSKYSYRQWERRRFCGADCQKRAARVAIGVEDGRILVWDGETRRYRSHVVMEATIGRALRDGEVVDHRNGNTADDRPENLRLFESHSAHMRAHWREGTIVRVPGTVGTTRAKRDERGAA